MRLQAWTFTFLLMGTSLADREWPFTSSGIITFDSNSSAIVQFSDTENPSRQYLLNETVASFHEPAHYWGAGTVVTSGGAGSWNFNTTSPDKPFGPFHFNPIEGLSLSVTRATEGDVLTERYTFNNTSPDNIEVTGIRIQTPFNDLYDGAKYSLDRAVNAHVFTGGKWAWALAQPMSGEGKSLGLILREGHLWSYSIENTTSSNVRGHVVLQATDRSRNSEAFGGQPSIEILPGQSYTLEWDIALYDTVDDFLNATDPPARFSSLRAPLNQSIILETDEKPSSPNSSLHILPAKENKYELRANSHGLYQIDIGEARTQVSFYHDLETTVKLRAEYMLERQRPTYLEYPLNASFVPYDTVDESVLVKPWSDKGDGSERLAMPTLLQLGAMRGWLDKELVQPALDQWVDFASTFLFGPEGNTTRCSGCGESNNRPYDALWFVGFFNDRYTWLGNSSDLDTAITILDYSYEVGETTEIPVILYSQTVLDLCENLEKAGRHDESSYFKSQLITLATTLTAAGHDLPSSEVSYEQAIVEPLLELVADAYTLTGNSTFLEATQEILNWTLAFNGRQPHTRQHNIAIRHWDDFYFGEREQFGDVYPHYWSALTAQGLLRLPTKLRTQETDEQALDILRGNMVNYFEDGAATCAFVFPSELNGEPAYAADPLANDQDWHLVIWMRALDWGVPNA